MDYGWTSLCLPANDLDRSRRFYEALGMEVIDEVDDLRVVLRNGPFRLALMPFLTEPLLNWRCGDIAAIHDAVKGAWPEASGAVRRYRADDVEVRPDADGSSWVTRDPNGHEILFDTNALETSESGRAARVSAILHDAEQALERAGASDACLAALRTEVIERFADPAQSTRA